MYSYDVKQFYNLNQNSNLLNDFYPYKKQFIGGIYYRNNDENKIYKYYIYSNRKLYEITEQIKFVENKKNINVSIEEINKLKIKNNDTCFVPKEKLIKDDTINYLYENLEKCFILDNLLITKELIQKDTSVNPFGYNEYYSGVISLVELHSVRHEKFYDLLKGMDFRDLNIVFESYENWHNIDEDMDR